MIYENETEKIIKAFYEVHKELGCGFLEPVYQLALAREFELQGIPFEKEKKIKVMYKGQELTKDYYADFVCFGKIIIELKAVSKLVNAHKAQVINYLNATKMKLGILVNFGEASCKYERIINKSLLPQRVKSVGLNKSVDIIQYLDWEKDPSFT